MVSLPNRLFSTAEKRFATLQQGCLLLLGLFAVLMCVFV